MRPTGHMQLSVCCHLAHYILEITEKRHHIKKCRLNMKMSALDLADIRNIIHQPLNITPCRLQLVQVFTDNRLLVNMRFGNIGKSENCVKGVRISWAILKESLF